MTGIEGDVDWYENVFEVIDMRSFSNLWFWIALAVVWSTASHWVLGVPFDMVARARRYGGQADAKILRIWCASIVNRLLFIGNVSGLWVLGFTCFILTGLALLGFVYGVEFAQATFLLGFPMSLVGALNLSTARLIQSEASQGEAVVQTFDPPPHLCADHRDVCDFRHGVLGHVSKHVDRSLRQLTERAIAPI